MYAFKSGHEDTIALRFKEQFQYMTPGNHQSAYALLVLHNADEYRPLEATLTLLYFTQKSKWMKHRGKQLHSILQPTQLDYYSTDTNQKQSPVQINLWHTTSSCKRVIPDCQASPGYLTLVLAVSLCRLYYHSPIWHYFHQLPFHLSQYFHSVNNQ
jgi:hypothetical protein